MKLCWNLQHSFSVLFHPVQQIPRILMLHSNSLTTIHQSSHSKSPGINYRAIHGKQQQTFISYSLEDFFMSSLYSGKYTSQYSPRESQPMGHRWFGDADDRQIDR